MTRVAVALLSLLVVAAVARAADPLPSWHDTPAKARIVAFVEQVTAEGTPGYVPPDQRIAVFDNDGCLWAEQPMYFQLLFTIDRIRAMASEHAVWKDEQPYKAAIEGDMNALAASGKEGLMTLIAATHTGMTVEEFNQSVRDWLDTARHPTLGRRYDRLIYQPKLELLAYLRASGFKPFIVSGGGVDFIRVFAQEAYGIPPEQVVGSRLGASFEVRDGIPVVVKQPDDLFIDDKAGKPVGIHQHIGRRPILAVGNSDGDYQMLQYTTAPRDAADTTPRLGVLIHHTDADREFAYDRESHVGKLAQGLDDGPRFGWLIVDMKTDWARVFPADE